MRASQLDELLGKDLPRTGGLGTGEATHLNEQMDRTPTGREIV
jgi:hypothetical protein